VRCQGERLEQRLARREELETRLAAERAPLRRRRRAGWIPQLYFLQRGMSEGELITIAGARTWCSRTCSPTSATPICRRRRIRSPPPVTVIGGRVNHIERVRKF
jgi:hypothetical protein